MADLTLFERVELHTKGNPEDSLVPDLAYEIGRLQYGLRMIADNTFSDTPHTAVEDVRSFADHHLKEA